MTESVLSTLRGVLGDTAAEALIFHLDLSEGKMVTGKLQGRLEDVLGGGSGVIENLIVSNFSKTLGMRINEGVDYRFGASIEMMRKEFVG